MTLSWLMWYDATLLTEHRILLEFRGGCTGLSKSQLQYHLATRTAACPFFKAVSNHTRMIQ